MKALINYIKELSDNDLEFYGAVISLLLSTLAAFLSYKWREIKIIFYLSCVIFFFAALILVYVGHFQNVKPFIFSITLSVIVTILTGIILIVYLKFFKSASGFSIPVAFVSQLVLANLIKNILNLNN